MKQFTPQADKQSARSDTASHLHQLNIRFVDRANGIFGMTDGSQWPIREIERVVACFTPGTGIATPKGEVAVERLKKGDRVLTRDNGIQTIRWIGQKKL
ncbi:MAG TPA: Hint domain-containing protein, partial [Paracoccaceae bacterium]|nr:Hint domain-containing protein [Paracoccaceae bacterium]